MRASATQEFNHPRRSDHSYNDSGLGGNTTNFKEGGEDSDHLDFETPGNFVQDEDMMVNDMIQGIGKLQDPGDAIAIAKERMEDAIISSSSRLHLEGLDLQDINFMDGAVWQNLEEIFLPRNMLVSIDLLSNFPNI